VDGICVPVSEEELADSKLITQLQKITPEKIWNDIGRYAALLR